MRKLCNSSVWGVELPIHAVHDSHASSCEYHQTCMSAAPQFPMLSWTCFEGAMRTSDYPSKLPGTVLHCIHVQVHGQSWGDTYNLISHCEVTMPEPGPAPVGRRPIGNIPAAGMPWLPMHRDPRNLSRGVATHRLQVTMCILALLGRLLGLG